MRAPLTALTRFTSTRLESHGKHHHHPNSEFSDYSIPVPLGGTSTASGYSTTAFTFNIQTTADFKTWFETIALTNNPNSLPPPPGSHFITFRHQTPNGQR